MLILVWFVSVQFVLTAVLILLFVLTVSFLWLFVLTAILPSADSIPFCSYLRGARIRHHAQKEVIVTMLLLRGVVVFSYLGSLSSADLQFHVAQFADYYGVLNTDIIVIQF